MKKVIFILMALVIINVSAQGREHRMNKMKHFNDFSPSQIAQIKTKKLTLSLDLNVAQQKQIETLEINKAENRNAKIKEREGNRKNNSIQKPSADERFKLLNERLDKQIAAKKEMKLILNGEQYTKWEKVQYSKNIHEKHLRKQKRKHKQ